MMWSIPTENQLEKAVLAANKSDVVVLALGLNERLEGEEMKVEVEGFADGDRTSLNLPKKQVELMKEYIIFIFWDRKNLINSFKGCSANLTTRNPSTTPTFKYSE